MGGVPEERVPPAAAMLLVVFKGEDEVNLADAVAEEQLGVGLRAPILAVLQRRKLGLNNCTINIRIFN